MLDIKEETNIRINQIRSKGKSVVTQFKSLISNSKMNEEIIMKYLRIAENATYNHPGQSNAIYLCHPIRMAKIAIEEIENTNEDLVCTCLVHNLKELDENSYKEKRNIMSDQVANAIDILTINRELRWKKEYLRSYYNNILKEESFASKVKILDKLDNLFLLCLNKDELIRTKYLEEIQEFLYPMIDKHMPEMKEYIVDIVRFNYEIGHINYDLEK